MLLAPCLNMFLSNRCTENRFVMVKDVFPVHLVFIFLLSSKDLEINNVPCPNTSSRAFDYYPRFQ